MNIFESANGLLGDVRPDGFKAALSEFFTISADIRERLGDRGGLLTEYLERVFDALCENNTETAAAYGFSNAGDELRELCGKIIRGSRKVTRHPFYLTAKRYIDTHPLPYREDQSRLEVYTVALVGDFCKYAVEKYYKEFSGRLESSGHIPRIAALYDEICGVHDAAEPLNRLNAVIQNGFITVPAMASFTQGIIDDALLSLLFKEPETGKYVFEMPQA